MLADLTAFLKAMHLYGMAAALAELDAERPRQPPEPEIWLQRLIEAKTVDRQARSLRYQMHVARFPIHSDLAHFDWALSPVSQPQIEQLASGQFMAEAHNLILVGGTGKTHLATALGVAAIHQGKRVFTTPWTW